MYSFIFVCVPVFAPDDGNEGIRRKPGTGALSIPAWGRVGMTSPDGGGCLQIDSACNHSGGPVVGGRAQPRAPCARLMRKKLEPGVCARASFDVSVPPTRLRCRR